jgi:hypothetical protein
MLLNLVIWLIAVAVVCFLTRDRNKTPNGVDHPTVLRTQPAYRGTTRTS